MSYEDDELERMRVRREQRKNGGHRTESEYNRRSSTTEAFKSGYNGPKSDSRSGIKGQNASSGGRRNRPDKKKRIMIIIAEVLLLLAIVVGAAGWYVYQRTFGSLADIEFNTSEVENLNLSDKQLEVMKGYLNIACFGVDSRSVGGKQNVGKGTNADVNLICSVNMETGEIRLVSVFRDTYLNINDKNSYNKINAAYASGGPEQAVKALNKNMGLNIKQYATFNWKAVADAINILDGVDIEVSDNEFSWINAYITETVKETGIGSVQLKHAGLVHMDGVQAVAYGRLRLGDTDYARTERQRIVMQKAFDKAKQADWATLNNLITTIMPQLATNVQPTDLIPLARNISKYHIGETSGFPSARGEGTIGKLGDCVVAQTLETNVKELHRFLFDVENYQVPANVKEYSAHISEVSGMYKDGKHIGHVPVDKGVSSKNYINQKQQKTEKAEPQKTTEESGTVETMESTVDESSTESTAESGSESSGESSSQDDNWDEEEWDNDWNQGQGSNGPGTGGPGSGTAARPTQPVIVRPGEKTTAANEGGNATGPGMSPSETTSGNDKTNSSGKPSTAAPGESQTAPGSDKTNNSGKPITTTEAAVGPGA